MERTRRVVQSPDQPREPFFRSSMAPGRCQGDCDSRRGGRSFREMALRRWYLLIRFDDAFAYLRTVDAMEHVCPQDSFPVKRY